MTMVMVESDDPSHVGWCDAVICDRCGKRLERQGESKDTVSVDALDAYTRQRVWADHHSLDNWVTIDQRHNPGVAEPEVTRTRFDLCPECGAVALDQLMEVMGAKPGSIQRKPLHVELVELGDDDPVGALAARPPRREQESWWSRLTNALNPFAGPDPLFETEQAVTHAQLAEMQTLARTAYEEGRRQVLEDRERESADFRRYLRGGAPTPPNAPPPSLELRIARELRLHYADLVSIDHATTADMTVVVRRQDGTYISVSVRVSMRGGTDDAFFNAFREALRLRMGGPRPRPTSVPGPGTRTSR